MVEYLKEEEGDLWLTEDEQGNLKVSYRIKEVVYEEKTAYQHLMIVESCDFGRMLVLDGVVQTTSVDGHIYNEMISHVPISIHPSPKKVLIIGGGDCGVAREVCKYEDVERIDMVEIDRSVVAACKKYLPVVSGNLSDPRVHYTFEDGIVLASTKQNEYDVIIVDSSDPVGPAQALFEQTFYESVYHALKEDGLMVCQSQSPIFHKKTMLNSYQYLGGIFPHVKLYTAVVPTYPGGLWSFTIGSKRSISPVTKKVKTCNTKYVNEQIIESCFSLPQFITQLLKREE